MKILWSALLHRATIKTKLCDGAEMAILATFLRPVFPASRARHVSDLHSKFTLECEPMPNVMVALPNIGGALCSTPQFG